MNDGFYRAFEDRHRGSRDLIKERLEAYLPFIRPLGHLYPGATAIDLGCGRGEFLEVLESVGLSAAGVDLDAGMLDACRERGLAVQQDDALAYLASLTDESQAVVSAFHVVEHISFDQLRQLVAEALRVLLPGGLLIMETPNPENIIVATRHFYVDPTHVRPIPPQLLEFVTEFHGFKRVKTIRLQESKELAQKEIVTLLEVLQGVSPDYAVVAQKDAPPDILAATAPVFDKQYGLTLEVLTARYDKTLHSEALQAESKAQEAEAKAQEAEAKAQEAEAKAQVAEAKAQETVSVLTEVLQSRSWRFTAPMRWLGVQVRRLRDQGLKARLGALVKKTGRPLARRAIKFVDTRPKLRLSVIHLARKLGAFDRLHARYRRMTFPDYTSASTAAPGHFMDPHQMPVRVERIYFELKQAMQGGNR